MPFHIPDELYYVYSTTTVAYTHRPQNKLNIHRLLRQEPCWESRNSSTSLKPKTLIIADWSLAHQSDERLGHILKYIDFLLKQDFLIYVWYDDDFVKLDDASFLGYEEYIDCSKCDLTSFDLSKIFPQQTEVITEAAVKQLAIPKDQLFVLQSNHLDNFSGFDDGYCFQLDALNSYEINALSIRLVEFLKLEKDKIDGLYDLEEYDDYPRSLFPFLSDVLIKSKVGVHRHAYFIRDYSYLPHYANLSRTHSCKQLYINGSELLSDSSLLDIFRAFNTLISISLISFDLHAHHETLEQMSLMVKRNQASLKRLAVTDGFFNRLLIDGVAEPLALDFLALNLAAADLDFMRFNQYLIRTTSLTHLKIDRLIELPIPLCLGNIKKFDVCFDAAIESSKQSRYNLLETLRLSTGLEKLSLEIRNTRHLVGEYWPIRINLKGLKKLKIEYMNNQFSWIKFSSLLGPLMAEDVVIEALDLYLVHFTPFTETDQHCLTKFVEISFNFCRLDNAFENIIFPKLQKLNFLCSNQFTMSTGFENCEFPALTHLCFAGHNISLETIKRIIRAAPNLQFVVINQHASKMDEELDKMLSAIPNHAYVFQNNTNLDDDNSDDASEMTDNQAIVSKSAAVEIRPTVSKPSTRNSYPLDARTSLEQNSAPLRAKQIFRGENGEEIWCASYRLKVYDEMRLDNFDNILQQTSENELFDQRFIFSPYFQVLGAAVYTGECELELSQNWVALPSLSMTDKLISIHTFPDTPDLITAYSNRLNLRYISSPSMLTPQKRRVVFRIESSIHCLDAYRRLPQAIVAQIEALKSFTSGDLQGDTSTPLALLQTLMFERKGACRHRAILFKKFADDHGLHCRVVVNDIHAFVELLFNQCWYLIDLGGYPLQVNVLNTKKSFSQKMEDLQHQWHQNRKKLDEWYESTKMQVRQNTSFDFAGRCMTNLRISYDLAMRQAQDDFVQKGLSLAQEHELLNRSVIGFLKDPLVQEFTDNTALIDYLSAQKDGSKILIDTNFKQAGLYSLMLHETLQTHGGRVFIAHSSDDLICSSFLELQADGYGMQKSSGGPLHDFLSTEYTQLVLIINYTNFKADEIVRYSHGLFDREPKVDGISVPKHIRIIGIFDSKDKHAYLGDDFLGRFDETVIAKAKPNWPPPRFFSSYAHDYLIELSGSSNWQTQLSGQWSMHQGRPFFMPALHGNIPENVNLVLNNPPYQDKSFHAFMGQAMLENRFKTPSIRFSYDRNWERVEIEPLMAFSANTFILNAETSSQFIKRFELIPEGLTQIPGYIEQHSSQTIEVYVNDALDEMVFDELFQVARRFDCRFQMAFAPDLIPDEFFNDKITSLMCHNWQQNIIITNDADLFISQRQLARGAVLIYVDDLTLDDIFFAYQHERHEDNVVVLRHKSGLYQLIEAGQHVILTGHLSEKLALELSVFLFAERKNQQLLAQLMIITDTNIPGFTCEKYQFSHQDRYQHLMQHFPEALIAQEKLDRPFVECWARLLFKQRYPHRFSDDLYLGLNQIHRFNWNRPINFETEAQDAQNFGAARFEQINQVLSHSPYVFIAGLTGVGKSQFIEKEYQGHQLFREKSELMAWARAMPQQSEWVILFFDEANLQNNQWMAFEGMFAERPYIFIEGELIYLSPKHKLIFAGNPAAYGDDRKTPKLIQRHGLSIVFEPLSPAFIFQKVILPIVGKGDPLKYLLAAQIASTILPMYQFLLNLSTKTLLVTPRQIETITNLTLQAWYKSPQQQLDISKCCIFYCHEVFAACLNESDYAILSEHFPNQPKICSMFPTVEAYFRNSHFYLTASRLQVIEQILDFLSITCGIKRLVIEGEPGVGKSDLMLNVLRAWGRENETFIYMPASLALSDKKALLFEAFDRGQVVFTDEINTSVFFEQILNSLLDNKHPDEQGRPAHRPGFKLIGTQNGIVMSGRTLESPAVKSRSMLIRLPRYSADEIYELAIHLGLNAYSALKLKQAYISVMPSFRGVLRWIEQEKKSPNLIEEQRFFQQLLDDQTPQAFQQRMSSFGA